MSQTKIFLFPARKGAVIDSVLARVLLCLSTTNCFSLPVCSFGCCLQQVDGAVRCRLTGCGYKMSWQIGHFKAIQLGKRIFMGSVSLDLTAITPLINHPKYFQS
jgi:hypothetical protein